MVMISLLYPADTGGRFDLAYYLNTHMPLSIARLSAHAGFKGVSVVHGIGGATPGSEPAYVAMCHYLFELLDGFLAAFTPHAAVLQADMRNYTDQEPIIQISAVDLVR